jgi:hypothetical protein
MRISVLQATGVFLLGFIAGRAVDHLDPRQFDANYLDSFRNEACVQNAPVFTPSKAVKTPFVQIVEKAYNIAFDNLEDPPSSPFNLSAWTQRTTGGLDDKDRIMVAAEYAAADSVFEYGLGESTYIANHVGVKRYAGIDSNAEYVSMARGKVSNAFRFYLADIGSTTKWGYPRQKLDKQILDFQLAPLIVEPHAFDVYMVDGRFRFPCVIASFLHAAARGGDRSKTKVMLHDCTFDASRQKRLGGFDRKNYHAADHLLNRSHSKTLLCVFTRMETTTDEQLLELWLNSYDDINR